MSRTVIVTGMWGPQRQSYAETFLSGFEPNWPKDVDLYIYTDGPIMDPGRAVVVNIARCDGFCDFLERHRSIPAHCGREPQPGRRWKPAAIAKGYNFRFDAVRFAGQAFVPHHAASVLRDGDLMVWLDADVVTHKRVPARWLNGLVGDADGAYLGRHPKHSEIGFWALRLSPEARAFLETFRLLYVEDGLFDLKEWHSAFAWDDARVWAESHGILSMRNLTPGGDGHVWFKSPLRHHLDHLKGGRKLAGRSPERRG